LHDEVLELRERSARMVLIGVRHRRVLAHDVHAGDLAFVDGVHDLDDGEAALRIERLAPEVFVPASDVELLDGLVVGEVHRDQARIGSALHVVLAAQRMQTGAGPADLARDQRERDQAARVVGAVRVLRDAHAPEDDRRFRRRVDARDGTQHVRLDVDDLRHRLWREVLDLGLQGLEARDVLANVGLVVELLVDDRMEQRVQQRDVAAGLELKRMRRVAHQVLAARIDDDELGAALRRLLEERSRDRMVHGRPRADDDDAFGVQRRVERRRYRARAYAFHERRDGRRMAEPRAVVDVVRLEARAHELLE
jgi:hypothetical protein